MNANSNEKENAVFGDVTFEVQLGIFGKNIDEETLDPYLDLEDLKMTNIENGLVRYSIGSFTNLQSAMLKHTAIEKLGFENTYIIAFYNGTQISLKKAQELIGF